MYCCIFHSPSWLFQWTTVACGLYRRRRRATGTIILTRDAVLTLALHLQRLHVDALVPDEASAGDAPVWLTEAFVTRSGRKKKRGIFFFHEYSFKHYLLLLVAHRIYRQNLKGGQCEAADVRLLIRPETLGWTRVIVHSFRPWKLLSWDGLSYPFQAGESKPQDWKQLKKNPSVMHLWGLAQLFGILSVLRRAANI